MGKDGVGQECWPQMASALPTQVTPKLLPLGVSAATRSPVVVFLFQDVNKEADHHMSGQLAGLGHQVDAFDWEGDRRLQHAEEDLIVYEMHVRGFTADTSSGAEEPGTYKAVSVPQNAMLVEGFLW